ncbi:ABC-type dipeptide transportsystem periplasmic component [Candidatus Brocadia sinica JPN1]|uniref:ABC-type dipeptide transportsystem periplasmic component n=1 Tax=Candidatus Brocadia sinica JPN1 TaxID=1197129 RepID=A0ABQ0K106_9BACT|nr:hypothetical protein [Candidatus Brocadia sp. AMX1]GAN34681.1 ABC-type dipeptide transportsystem periplasmic component [Candidatus Brocadia sinica JPN1]
MSGKAIAEGRFSRRENHLQNLGFNKTVGGAGNQRDTKWFIKTKNNMETVPLTRERSKGKGSKDTFISNQ